MLKSIAHDMVARYLEYDGRHLSTEIPRRGK